MLMKEKNLINELVEKDCRILDVYRNKVIVNCSTGKLITERLEEVKKGDIVEVYKIPFLGKITEILIYLSPLYYLLIGFGLGFLFGNDLYHYLLTVGAMILGIVQMIICKFWLNKSPKYKYVARKQKINKGEKDENN